MRLRLLLAFIALLLLPANLQAQERSPISWQHRLEPVDPIILPPLDLEAIRVEDSINDLDKSQPWRYGIVRPVVVDMDEQGLWTDLPNGDRLWRAAIHSPDAIHLSINFDRFYIPSGGYMQLFNDDQSDYSKVYTSQQKA